NQHAYIPKSQPIPHSVWIPDPAAGPDKGHEEHANKPRKPDRTERGRLDTIAGLGLSKNAICVGATQPNFEGPIDPDAIAYFSSWGPADDGRVKPDVVAPGERVWIDRAGVPADGTSFASPTVAGIAALLSELFKSALNRAPKSAEIKAVLIHTAH